MPLAIEKYTVGGGGLEFNIREIPTMKGFQMLEKIRYNLDIKNLKIDFAGLAVTDNEDRQLDAVQESLMSLIHVIMKLDTEFVEWLRKSLFEEIDFRNKHTKQRWQNLLGNEDTAFDRTIEGVNPMTVYEVLVRSFKVNFSECWGDLMKLAGFAMGSSPPQEEAPKPKS